MQTDYALRALLTLARHQGTNPLPISRLAKENDIPKRFLEQIMLALKSRGWVRSTTGKFGGYLLARSPENISMGEVVRFFDGTLAPIGCVSVTDYRCCNQEAKCRFRRILLQARNMVADLMDRTSLADVIQERPVAMWEIQGLNGDGI